MQKDWQPYLDCLDKNNDAHDPKTNNTNKLRLVVSSFIIQSLKGYKSKTFILEKGKKKSNDWMK